MIRVLAIASIAFVTVVAWAYMTAELAKMALTYCAR